MPPSLAWKDQCVRASSCLGTKVANTWYASKPNLWQKQTHTETHSNVVACHIFTGLVGSLSSPKDAFLSINVTPYPPLPHTPWFSLWKNIQKIFAQPSWEKEINEGEGVNYFSNVKMGLRNEWTVLNVIITYDNGRNVIKHTHTYLPICSLPLFRSCRKLSWSGV